MNYAPETRRIKSWNDYATAMADQMAAKRPQRPVLSAKAHRAAYDLVEEVISAQGGPGSVMFLFSGGKTGDRIWRLEATLTEVTPPATATPTGTPLQSPPPGS